MRSRVSLFSLVTCFALVLGAGTAYAESREDARLINASNVLKELQATRDQYIPDLLLERAYGIAVLPNVTKAAFFAGGRRGKGVLVVRDSEGRFTNPVFITLTGGSIGFQWGVQSADIVLVFTTRRGIEGITDGKLTLGADASVAAGPVGRQASAATDASFSAEVYSYSRTRGLFAGIAVDGSALTIDEGANSSFYARPGVMASDIINGSVTTSSDYARNFLAVVASSTTVKSASSATQPSAAPGAGGGGDAGSSAVNPAPAQPAPASNDGVVKTFPMEDPQPGQEPR